MRWIQIDPFSFIPSSLSTGPLPALQFSPTFLLSFLNIQETCSLGFVLGLSWLSLNPFFLVVLPEYPWESTHPKGVVSILSEDAPWDSLRRTLWVDGWAHASLPQPSLGLPSPVLSPFIRAGVRKDKRERGGRLTLGGVCCVPDCNLTMFPWKDTSSVKRIVKEQTSTEIVSLWNWGRGNGGFCSLCPLPPLHSVNRPSWRWLLPNTYW